MTSNFPGTEKCVFAPDFQISESDDGKAWRTYGWGILLHGASNGRLFGSWVLGPIPNSGWYPPSPVCKYAVFFVGLLDILVWWNYQLVIIPNGWLSMVFYWWVWWRLIWSCFISADKHVSPMAGQFLPQRREKRSWACEQWLVREWFVMGQDSKAPVDFVHVDKWTIPGAPDNLDMPHIICTSIQWA